MIASMTGYGASTISNKDLDIKCEVLCLNKKNLEININSPRFSSEFELDLRKIVKNKLIRGKVNVNFDIKFVKNLKTIKLNKPLFNNWIQTLNEISTKHSVQGSVSISDLITLPDIWQKEETKVPVKIIKTSMEAALNKAVTKLIEMRKKEGKNLQNDILSRINKIEKTVLKIDKIAPKQLKEYEKKIKSKIDKNNTFSKAESDLFNRFISAFSSKTDIMEEIIRLKSHISQFKSFLSSKTPVGRSLDFLLQEFLREANTINSKSNNIKISQNILEIKTLIEQIREQTQNIL